MTSMKTFGKIILTGALLAALPLMAGAATNPSGADIPGQVNISNPNDLLQLFRTIINWIAAIFFLTAVVYVFWAGWTYLQAGGDPGKIEEGRNRLIYAAIAIAIGLIAWSVPTLVRNFIG